MVEEYEPPIQDFETAAVVWRVLGWGALGIGIAGGLGWLVIASRR